MSELVTDKSKQWSDSGSIKTMPFWLSLPSSFIIIGPESDHWQCLSVTDSLTDWLTNWLLFSKLDWCDPGVWRCQLKTCWGLLLLLMLMMRIVLATVWCILGSSGKIFKLEFGHYFASDILQRLRSWILIEMLKLGSVNILNFKFSRDGDVWLRFWSKCLVEILKMKFD